MAQKFRTFKRNIGTLTLLCVMATMAACSVNPKGHELDARKELESIKGPEIKGIAGTMKDQADAAAKAGQLGQAEVLYRQLLDKEPDNVDYRYAYGDMLRRQDRCPEAQRQYQLVLAKNATHAASLEGKGLCVMAGGDTQAATKIFGDVMKADPTRWRTLNAIGILFGMKGMTKEAMAYYDEALKYNPGSVSVQNNIGLTQALNKQYSEAVVTFEKLKAQLAEDSPDIKRISLNLALAYGLAGKMEDAEKAATPYLSKTALYNNLGFYAHLAKDDSLAKSYLNMALSSSPVYYERAWDNLQVLSSEDKKPADKLPALPK